MLEKFFLAVTITLCLKFFLGVGLPTTNPTASGYRLGETTTPLAKLLFSHRWQQNLLLPLQDS